MEKSFSINSVCKLRTSWCISLSHTCTPSFPRKKCMVFFLSCAEGHSLLLVIPIPNCLLTTWIHRKEIVTKAIHLQFSFSRRKVGFEFLRMVKPESTDSTSWKMCVQLWKTSKLLLYVEFYLLHLSVSMTEHLRLICDNCWENIHSWKTRRLEKSQVKICVPM